MILIYFENLRDMKSIFGGNSSFLMKNKNFENYVLFTQ